MGAQSTTPTYTAGKDSPAREPSRSAFWLQMERMGPGDGGVVGVGEEEPERGEGALVAGGKGMRRSVNPIPNPDPNPKQAPQLSLKEAQPR